MWGAEGRATRSEPVDCKPMATQVAERRFPLAALHRPTSRAARAKYGGELPSASLG